MQAFFQRIKIALRWNRRESWKNLKQITSRHLTNNTRLDGVAGIDELEIALAINLTDAVGKFISDAFCMILFGSTEVRVLDLVAQIEKQAINVNIGNLFPALDFLDLHGVNKTMKETLMPELEQLLIQVIGAHKQNKARIESQGQEFVSRDLTDVLLSLESLRDISIVALLTVSDTTHFSVWNLLFAQDILVAGVDTIKWTAVWAMAEVLRNSRVMEKAQEAVKNTIGKSQLVKHSDLVNLPYIEAIFKEVLRVHPVGALGVPHHNPSKATLAGYDIPKHCTVLINIWAIGHDPRHWEKPEVFRLERFLGDRAKSNQELMIPFSAGRRTCPGMPIASRVVPFVVASLLHAFDWKSEGEIDLSERSSGTLSCMPASNLVAFASEFYWSHSQALTEKEVATAVTPLALGEVLELKSKGVAAFDGRRGFNTWSEKMMRMLQMEELWEIVSPPTIAVDAHTRRAPATLGASTSVEGEVVDEEAIRASVAAARQ
ncbi:3,9-dihydroxypterocarpan 6A-monooxygenase-like [Selaginella moellendorffii]|uniref:3,9-dihydroxypterocarpan 6A-monooxygenase-like n=1 Tax=Selaginella moellendorffii TaxID=88036 RepID=UPI000D1C7678|nr:3,9-dihydroxypterocarpan 6A-monooxygenase-like [Selaginella moellendorffii]|eukprot:XP_024539376.1 3,9-dihydroxypterocarpan 6A-monooxygenase-like [Selaginella moellendorffii]